MAATKAGDVATVLSLMADDVVFMVPGHEPFGKEEFEAASESNADVQIEGTNEIVELRILGNWAFTRNRIEMRVTSSGSEPVSRSGYTLTLWHKEADEKWRLARDANLLTT